VPVEIKTGSQTNPLVEHQLEDSTGPEGLNSIYLAHNVSYMINLSTKLECSNIIWPPSDHFSDASGIKQYDTVLNIAFLPENFCTMSFYQKEKENYVHTRCTTVDFS